LTSLDLAIHSIDCRHRGPPIRRSHDASRKAILVASERDASSYLLYLQDRTVLARRFDLRWLALIGDPVPLATNVALSYRTQEHRRRGTRRPRS
jgi:hypothetical protein